MATIEPCDNGLQRRLEVVLPKGHQFSIYHLSTPPSKSAPLCSAPPKERPDRTCCESHFLNVAINVPVNEQNSSSQNGNSSGSPKRVLVFGVEILIYTTSYTTTLFVSKADSTGYLHLLNLPNGTPSPIREVCAAFISHLAEKRRRRGKQLVISLFARAQNQYLYPGSIDYSGKHVLDDRGLVKWWCRVLSPILESPPSGTLPPWNSTRGYLVVPGLDLHEMRAFVPRDALSSWSLTHPLEQISHYTKEFDWVPPRCLIPRYPDDPKSRFRDELDEEAATSGAMQNTGSWKSVKTLDMFWEMMSFRQECSSGRMTGFIWLVFDDQAQDDLPPAVPQTPKKQRTISISTPGTTPRKLFGARGSSAYKAQEKKNQKDKNGKTKLRGVIKPRQPKVKTEHRNYLLDRPISTPYYYWPQAGRGERIVTENDYKRIVELLLHLDFATLDKATGSTRRWVSEVGMGSTWGYDVTGRREPVVSLAAAASDGQSQVNNLSGLVKRKRNSDTTAPDTNGAVNTLGAGLIRKKPKVEE
jgi:regulator of Ty1 transposition protein 109